MELKPWMSASLSAELASLCETGEGQALEFKRQLPDQLRDLAKEVAAFATSNDGLILLGVADDGALVGLRDVDELPQRDELTRRVAGVCNLIDPPVRPGFEWAEREGRVVFGIRVARGTEPLYYVDNRPILRHGSISRPARPAEVIEAIKRHLGIGDVEQEPDSFLSRLAELLANVMRWCDVDPDLRSLDPYVTEWTSEARHGADTLRDLAAEERAAQGELGAELRGLAQALDDVAGFRHTLGPGQSFEVVCANARRLAEGLFDKYVASVPLAAPAQESVKQEIVKTSRKLSELWARAEAAPFDVVPKAQEESGRLGRILAHVSYFPVGFLQEEDRKRLREIGLRLISLTAQTMYYDGGQSQNRAVEEGKSCASQLATLVGRIV